MTPTDPTPEHPAASHVPPATEIARLLTADIPEVPADFDPTAPFEQADIDSLVLAEAAVTATRLYGITVHDWELRDAGTMLAAAALVRDRAAGRVGATRARDASDVDDATD